ncbi:hypothetical protein Tsubulata_025331 [Turnera subulata]|uniref:Fe2OG dioxygenase domain-containing protein n=1 Tax=Turnera subulata TaxID=218843 RepID=A0A9Q0FFL1_9ROSI|nr:hypothetical protein Tsubulata_025331 [Turnera subulata]
MMEGKNVNKYQAFGDVPTVMYVPDFITPSEESHLLDKVHGAPLSKWKSLKNRRLQNWGGVVHEKGLLPQDLPPWLTKITQRISEESGLFPSPINHVLINEYHPDQGIMPHQDGPAYFPVVAIISLGSPAVMDFTPHSRLRKCNDGKGTDEDALESGTNEWMDNHHPFSVVLMPRSLLIFKDTAYSDYLHGIKDGEVHQYEEAINEGALINQTFLDSEPVAAAEVVESSDPKVIRRTTDRISLTCRSVLKVHKSLFKF